MATISAYTFNSIPRDSQSAISDDAAPADIVELADLPSFLPHVFLSIRFFDSGGLPVTPSGGTFAIEVQTQGNQPNWEDPPEPTIDATAPTTVDWASNTYGVRVTPTSLTGVDHWSVVVFLNKT